jgi:hypothetical protein
VEGPAWCEDLARAAAADGRAVVVAGQGNHEPPPGGAWLDDAVLGPWAPLGPAAGVLRAWLGLDAAALRDGALAMLERCTGSTLMENPARALAVGVRCAREAGAPRTLHFVQDSASEAVARWAARAWAPGTVAWVGDDDALEEARSSGDTTLLLWDPEPGRGGDGETASWIARREGLPLLRVGFPPLEGSALGAVLGLLAPVIAWDGVPTLEGRWETARSRVRASVDASGSVG